MQILKVMIILLISLISSKIAYSSQNMKKAYVRSVIIEQAKKSRYVSPSLALAVAKVESNFNANAVSPKGAIGVMQIMPRTALYEFGVQRKKLFNPDLNIKIGIKFLDHLISKYNGRIDIALSHYNGGSAVGKWPNVKIIPATYKYVVKVLKISEKYNKNQILNNQKLVYYKNIDQKIRVMTNLDKNIKDIDKWLDIYKKLKNNKNSIKKFDKYSMNYKIKNNL